MNYDAKLMRSLSWDSRGVESIDRSAMINLDRLINKSRPRYENCARALIYVQYFVEKNAHKHFPESIINAHRIEIVRWALLKMNQEKRHYFADHLVVINASINPFLIHEGVDHLLDFMRVKPDEQEIHLFKMKEGEK